MSEPEDDRGLCVSRRSALLGGSALGVTLAGGVLAAPAATQSLGVALCALVRDPEAARYLGRAYLAQGVDALAARSRIDALVGPARRSVDELRDVLRAASADDLARGDVAVVKGWVLSRTEAEVLALIALA